MKHRLLAYMHLMRWDRPIGTLLLLWSMLWGLWFAAHGRPDTSVFIVFMLGVFLMRSAGCVINDYADRYFDPHVERTRNRPLAAGRVSEKEALILFVVLCLIAFALVLTMNRLTIKLSLVAVLLASLYPFMKRYTHFPQLFFAASFSWSIPMAFAAQTGGVPPMAWLIFAASICWCIAYDTAYAMADRDEDLKAGIKSIAILFGRWDRMMIALLHGLCLAFLVYAGVRENLGYLYYFALILALGIAGYQQYLIRNRQSKRCFQAFLNNNWFGAVIYLGLLLDLTVSL